MPRDRNVARALALQRDPSLPPSLQLTEGLCELARPEDSALKERLERRVPGTLPTCRGGCAVCKFFEEARAAGARVELDIGCGFGRFGRAHAKNFPEMRLLGLEQDDARIARSDVIARRDGQTNLAYLACEARYAIEYCVPAESLDAAWILYPDPWPKARHAPHRIFRKPSIDALWRALKRGGVLHASTDNAPYFAQMIEVMRDDERFIPVAPYVRPTDERTDFELKFAGQGKVLSSASWRKL